MEKERKWKEAGSLTKVGRARGMALETRKAIGSSEQGAFDLMRRCRPCRYLPDSACGLRLASNQNPSCHSEISFGIRYRDRFTAGWDKCYLRGASQKNYF
jgi:hypothetical protein